MKNENSLLGSLGSLDNLFENLGVFDTPKKEIDPNEAKYITYSKQIDTKTTIRKRNRITPAVCLQCGLDLVRLAYEQNKLSTLNYGELTPQIQEMMENVVKRHVALVHSNAEALVLGESELPRKWLSSERGI